MAEIKQFIRTVKNNGDIVLSNVLDSITGELIELIKVPNPVGITLDGYIYRQMITVEHGTEVFKRIFDLDINVKWFGVKGDGITDDTDAIQKAIDTINNKTLVFPQGTYNISKTLNITSNKQIKFQGQGRLSRRGSTFGKADGLVKINWVGEDIVYTTAIQCPAGQADSTFHNIYLNNATLRTDIDGITIDQFVCGRMENVSVTSFRNNIVITGAFYYAVFESCMFSRAASNGFLCVGETLANGALFNACQFSLNIGIGFNAGSLGEVINFRNCYFELNGSYMMYIGRCKVLNITGGYLEFNCKDLAGTKAFIRFRNLGNSGDIPQNCILNLKENFIYTTEQVHIIEAIPSVDAGLVINISGNTFVENQITSSYDPTGVNNTYVVYNAFTPAMIHINFDGNFFTPNTVNPLAKIVSMNRPINTLGSYSAKNDIIVARTNPYLNNRTYTNSGAAAQNRGIKENNISVIPIDVTHDPATGNSTSILSINSPTISTAEGGVSIGRNTNTSGLYKTTLYKADNTAVATITFDHKTGNIISIGDVNAATLNTTGFTLNGNTKILSGTGDPESVVTATPGSLWLRTDDATSGNGLYIKRAFIGNTGWEKIWGAYISITDSNTNVPGTTLSAGAKSVPFIAGVGATNFPAASGGGVYYRSNAEATTGGSFKLFMSAAAGDVSKRSLWLQVQDASGVWQSYDRVAMIVSGTTAQRPTYGASDIGRQYADTTLQKPIWWWGAAWKDATGTTV